jgi:hypothetical protein
MADVELNDSSHESVLFLGDDETRRPAPAAATPLPVRQLAALCGVRLIDPIAFSQVFPYVNEMIDDLRLTSDPSRIGFYSGLVVRPALRLIRAEPRVLPAGEYVRDLPAVLDLPLGAAVW